MYKWPGPLANMKTLILVICWTQNSKNKHTHTLTQLNSENTKHKMFHFFSLLLFYEHKNSLMVYLILNDAAWRQFSKFWHTCYTHCRQRYEQHRISSWDVLWSCHVSVQSHYKGQIVFFFFLSYSLQYQLLLYLFTVWREEVRSGPRVVPNLHFGPRGFGKTVVE